MHCFMQVRCALLMCGVALSAAAGRMLEAQRATRAPVTGAAWRLVWRDEFDGARLDSSRWAYDVGNGFYADSGRTFVSGWGNAELQCYTSSSENAFLRDGALHIRAIASPDSTCAFTSARLTTRRADGSALVAPRYGRIEFRARLPVGRGLWPALWMLPLSEAYGSWAASGEIDVMEARGQVPGKVLGTLHYGSRWPHNAFTGMDYVLPHGGSIADWHVYGVVWDPGRISWSVDGVVYQTQSFWWSSSRQDGRQGVKPVSPAELNAWPAPFDQRFYLLMNLAVGGNFLGNPDTSTPFPAEMLVDYVRVYERRSGVGALGTRGAGAVPFRPR